MLAVYICHTILRVTFMYGKHFASMYTGSMVGMGAIAFAVMGYVIANAKPDKAVGMQVELNPILLAAMLGEDVDDVTKAIELLCSPDPRSRSKAEEGRRLVKIGEYDYRLVNGPKYQAIRDEEARREQNRTAQERFRRKKRGKPLPGQIANRQMAERGASEEELNRHVDSFSEPPQRNQQTPSAEVDGQCGDDE
jgi:hypothetical protein